MKALLHHATHWWGVVPLAIALVSLAPTLQAAEPVTVTVSVGGNAATNGRVVARASVDVEDGSQVLSYAWRQTGGVEARILSAADAPAFIVKLAPAWRYRDMLVDVLSEPPIGPEDLPPNVPLHEHEFPGGLQDRFQVVGINPFALEEAGLVTFEVEVKTTSGTYHGEAEVHTHLPWKRAAGIRNIPIGAPVLLHGKEQDSYNWSLVTPADSKAVLRASRTRTPWFTPDVPGIYEAAVRDQAAGERITLTIYAGTWRGVIVAQDRDGRPVAEGLCTSCHRTDFAPDPFTPWAQTGHAEIFTNNLNTSTHYSTNCFACHTVGYDPDVDNGGIDEARDFQAFLGSGLLNNPGDNWTRVLDEFPETAQMANAQCENCHGPQSSLPRQDTLAHGWMPEVVGEPRVSLSSDVCGTCHGEPLRHARFQQWQLSGHANYELAIEEGESGNCSRCHTANGFLEWLPVLLGEAEGDPTASIEVTWTSDQTHPQTCVTCHDPHDVGTTSGSNPNARVRISGDTPELIAGFQVVGAGRGAVCMTCHNSRRGLRNDDNFAELYGTSEAARAPHGSSQTDVLMGENAFGVNVGVRGRHSLIEDTCVTCHMETTPPPDLLSYNQGGTNHTFFASPDICTTCHEGVTAQGLQSSVEAVLGYLQGGIEAAIIELMAEQIALGYSIDLDGEATITSINSVAGVVFGEARGRQAITVSLASGRTVGPLRLTDVEVVRPAPLSPLELYDVADPGLVKAGWNWTLIHNDGSRGAHNPTFALTVLDAARDALGLQGGPRVMLPVATSK